MLSFAVREAGKNAPFVFGFFCVGAGIVGATRTITPEDVKASKMVYPGGSH